MKKKIEIATPEEVEAYSRPAGNDAGTVPADEAAQARTPEGEAKEGEVKEAEVQPEDELTVARRKIEELTDKHLRAVAEHQNYVRRSAAEHGENLRYAASGLVRSLIEVADDFERTLAAVAEDDSSPLAKGIRLVHQNLVKALETHHVQRIKSVGQPFDPSCHEAMMQRPTDDQPPGTVIEEYQAGYSLWDRVLRPAKVIIAQAVGEAESDGDAATDDANREGGAAAGGTAGRVESADAGPDKE